MTGALLLLSLAAAPEILLPPWPLGPDGEVVAVRGGDGLVAEGAAVEPISPGLFRVVPRDGAEEVRLSSGGASARARVDRSIGAIEVSFHPAAPVKGRDREVRLEISVALPPGAEAAERPPVIITSSGRVRDVTADGPGRFRAVFEPEATRHPEVAVLLALAPRCPLCATPLAVGHAIVPLSAAIHLPGASEPGVSTSIAIGGRVFGPVAADSEGRFSIPVVVPPGARTGSAVSVDRIGNRKLTEVDLHLPPVDRLACAAWPTAVPADGRTAAWLWCVASTASGAPAPDARIAIAASSGSLGPLAPFRGGLQRARWAAPRGGGGGAAAIAATYPAGGAASRHDLKIALATGAPAGIEVSLSREPVPLGAEVDAEAVVRDGRGDPVGIASGPPGAREGFVAPGRFRARHEPGDFLQEAPLRFALPPGEEPATLSLWRDGDLWVAEARTVDGRPAAGVSLRFGSGAEAVTGARGEARIPARGATETVRAGNGARAAGFAGAGRAEAPFEVERIVTVALAPRAAVQVLARVEGRRVHWRVLDEGGKPIPRRPIVLRSSNVELGAPEPDGDGGRTAIRGGQGPVAVVDVETGIAAVVEVP